MILEIAFWLLLFLIIYTFFGYPLLLWILVGIKNSIYGKPKIVGSNYEPDVCLFVTAYNEKEFVAQKVNNSLQLDYPKEKIQYLWITDGSDDGTPELLKEHMQNEVHHLKER
ncbi:MAG TPA: glycosyltransferase, partial [Mariniphaga sp.]|nr:glycosyltransferase [Mariniphaga sp.]